MANAVCHKQFHAPNSALEDHTPASRLPSDVVQKVLESCSSHRVWKFRLVSKKWYAASVQLLIDRVFRCIQSSPCLAMTGKLHVSRLPELNGYLKGANLSCASYVCVEKEFTGRFRRMMALLQNEAKGGVAVYNRKTVLATFFRDLEVAYQDEVSGSKEEVHWILQIASERYGVEKDYFQPERLDKASDIARIRMVRLVEKGDRDGAIEMANSFEHGALRDELLESLFWEFTKTGEVECAEKTLNQIDDPHKLRMRTLDFHRLLARNGRLDRPLALGGHPIDAITEASCYLSGEAADSLIRIHVEGAKWDDARIQILHGAALFGNRECAWYLWEQVRELPDQKYVDGYLQKAFEKLGDFEQAAYFFKRGRKEWPLPRSELLEGLISDGRVKCALEVCRKVHQGERKAAFAMLIGPIQKIASMKRAEVEEWILALTVEEQLELKGERALLYIAIGQSEMARSLFDPISDAPQVVLEPLAMSLAQEIGIEQVFEALSLKRKPLWLQLQVMKKVCAHELLDGRVDQVLDFIDSIAQSHHKFDLYMALALQLVREGSKREIAMDLFRRAKYVETPRLDFSNFDYELNKLIIQLKCEGEMCFAGEIALLPSSKEQQLSHIFHLFAS
ncbi:MAG: hypothetical protein S4CHLAM102_08040 [Chlamydiia bacterium]|nr:hypothetical protein [Chlamydiia bacterium]